MTKASTHIAVLRQTRRIPHCLVSDVEMGSKISRTLLEESLVELHETGALTLDGEEIRVSPEQRMRIAELAIALGCDPEKVARQLRWQEFETFADQVLNKNEYATTTHFVFKCATRRFEIDVLGAREPMVLCIDCKHWHHGWFPGKIMSAAKNQLFRVESLSHVFARHEERLRTIGWKSVRLVPLVVSLADLSSRFVDGVPIVSALRFRTFLSEISPWVDGVRFIDARTI